MIVAFMGMSATVVQLPGLCIDDQLNLNVRGSIHDVGPFLVCLEVVSDSDSKPWLVRD